MRNKCNTAVTSEQAGELTCSIYTLVPALGDFDEPQRASITMFGVLTIAVRIYQDRWGYGIYSGPIGSAVFIITVKWVSFCP